MLGPCKKTAILQHYFTISFYRAQLKSATYFETNVEVQKKNLIE